jgi:hypothetical protein
VNASADSTIVGYRPIDQSMRQRCRLAVGVAGIVLAFASCQRVGQLENTLRELQQVKKEVSGLVDTDEVSVNINNGDI